LSVKTEGEDRQTHGGTSLYIRPGFSHPGSDQEARSGNNLSQSDVKVVGKLVSFGYHLSHARFQSRSPQFARGMYREHQYSRMRRQVADVARGLKPIHYGHLKIQDYDVRAKFSDSFHRFLSILRLAANFPIRAALDPRTHSMPNQGAVIDNKNCVFHLPAYFALGRLLAGPRRTARRTASRKGDLTLIGRPMKRHTVDTVRYRTYV
jgi:hypothetical protein